MPAGRIIFDDKLSIANLLFLGRKHLIIGPIGCDRSGSSCDDCRTDCDGVRCGRSGEDSSGSHRDESARGEPDAEPDAARGKNMGTFRGAEGDGSGEDCLRDGLALIDVVTYADSERPCHPLLVLRRPTNGIGFQSHLPVQPFVDGRQVDDTVVGRSRVGSFGPEVIGSPRECGPMPLRHIGGPACNEVAASQVRLFPSTSSRPMART